MPNTEELWAEYIERFQYKPDIPEYSIVGTYTDDYDNRVIVVKTSEDDTYEPKLIRIEYGNLDGDWDCLCANDTWAVLAVDPTLSDLGVLSIALDIAVNSDPETY